MITKDQRTISILVLIVKVVCSGMITVEHFFTAATKFGPSSPPDADIVQIPNMSITCGMEDADAALRRRPRLRKEVNFILD